MKQVNMEGKAITTEKNGKNARKWNKKTVKGKIELDDRWKKKGGEVKVEKV